MSGTNGTNGTNGTGRLAGKVALITGGARGQGAEEGRLFAAEGATVILTDVLEDEGGRTAAEIGAEFLMHDVGDEAQWETVVADVIAHHGRLDVLVNNAGIFQPKQLLKTSVEDWDRTIRINQLGVFLGLKVGGRAMIAAGNGGSIVNISSVAGLEGVFGSMAYGASKWAVRGMTKVAAKEFGRDGIRVNSVHPGIIETDMVSGMPAMSDDARKARLAASLPVGRLGTPRDIAEMVLFLASDASGFCTGQEFVVDGGTFR